MACAVDASSPIRWTGQTVGSNPENFTSAAFTAPANSLLVVCGEFDGDTAGQSATISDSGGLSWTEQVRRDRAETPTGAAAYIWTAIQVTSASRTVTVAFDANTSGVRMSAKCYVVTGADISGTPVDTVGANNESGSTTNDYTTPALTPGANGLLFGADCDFTAGGGSAAFEAPSDGSTQNTVNYPGQISVCDGYKACVSGVSVTMNFNAGGSAAAQHKECRIIVREAVSVSLPYILVAN